MTMTDPIADLLTRIRNAYKAKHEVVEISGSNIKKGVLSVLKEEGYISGFKVVADGKQGMISISLKYYGEDMQPVIKRIQRVSKPGLRQYVKREKIPKVLNGLGTAIISTSKGVVSGKKAKGLNVGGEFLCKVW